MKKIVSLVLLQLFIMPLVFAAEICGNGTDDDSDGLIDWIDPECNLSAPMMNCPATAFQVKEADTVWQSINLVAGSSTTNVDDWPERLNGIGYNVLDGRVWGSVHDSSQLFAAIQNPGPGWTVITTPVIAGTSNLTYNSSDVDANGQYYGGYFTSSAIDVIDLDSTSASYLTVVNTLTITDSVTSATVILNTPDIAFNPFDGLLYGIEVGSANLIVVDPATGVCTDLGATSLPTTSSFGAVYFDSVGYFYASHNSTGDLYRLDLTAGAAGYDMADDILFDNFGISTGNNDGARCTDAPVTVADLSITKDDGVVTAIAGDILTYTLTVANAGPNASGTLTTVEDVLPTDITVNGGGVGSVTLSGVNGADWSCSSDAASPQRINCSFLGAAPGIAASGSSVFSFVTDPVPAAVAGTTISNSATVTEGSDIVDLDADNNTSIHMTPIGIGVSICPAGTVLEDLAVPGNADVAVVSTNVLFPNLSLGPIVPVTTVLDDTNSARLVSSGPILIIDLTDVVPENGTIILSIARHNTSGDYTIDSGTDGINFNGPINFDTGPNGTHYWINYSVPAGGARYVRFVRTRGSLRVDGVQYAQRCVSSVDLTITKMVDNPTPMVGSTVTFSLVVENLGPSNATSIDVNDIVPAGFTYVAGSISGGDSQDDGSPAGTGLEWTINSLTAGSSAGTLTFTATVNPP